MQAPIVRFFYINYVVEKLEVVLIGNFILAECIYVGFGLIEGQGKEILSSERNFPVLVIASRVIAFFFNKIW